MAYTEHRFDPEEIKALVIERTKSLKANKGFSDLYRFGLSVIMERLSKDRLRYRDYGPYWPALKLLLNDAGYELGPQSDPIIAESYKGESPVETLMMADLFRDEYLATQFVGSNQFMLDSDTGEFWVLFDQDMEGQF